MYNVIWLEDMIEKIKKYQTHSEEGFTLIELMIVVVIIGILSAIAVPIFMNQQKGAFDASLKTDIKNAVTVIATEMSTTNPPGVSSNNREVIFVTPGFTSNWGNGYVSSALTRKPLTLSEGTQMYIKRSTLDKTLFCIEAWNANSNHFDYGNRTFYDSTVSKIGVFGDACRTI